MFEEGNRLKSIHGDDNVFDLSLGNPLLEPPSEFKNKPESSLVKSISLVKEKKCDAIISAGNTAALLSSSLFILGKIDGIKRPALATYIPTKEGGFI